MLSLIEASGECLTIAYSYLVISWMYIFFLNFPPKVYHKATFWNQPNKKDLKAQGTNRISNWPAIEPTAFSSSC